MDENANEIVLKSKNLGPCVNWHLAQGSLYVDQQIEPHAKCRSADSALGLGLPYFYNFANLTLFSHQLDIELMWFFKII